MLTLILWSGFLDMTTDWMCRVEAVAELIVCAAESQEAPMTLPRLSNVTLSEEMGPAGGQYLHLVDEGFKHHEAAPALGSWLKNVLDLRREIKEHPPSRKNMPKFNSRHTSVFSPKSQMLPSFMSLKGKKRGVNFLLFGKGQSQM